uniref:DUF19 domain-containing protein n=1 Tax=Tetranychus urticae TaxID=32264 RepID=T1K939_TETUR
MNQLSCYPDSIGKASSQTCHLRELDLCAATLLVFTQNPSGIATNDVELDKQCGYLKEADMCLKNFTRKCATSLQRDLITFITEGSTRLLNEYCTSGSQLRQSYLKHSECLNQATQANRKTCIKDLQLALETVSQVDWDQRIPTGCCAYRRFQECTETQVEAKCGSEAVEFMDIILRMSLSRLPDIVCPSYNPKTDQCKALLPESGATPKGPKSNSVLSRLFSAYTGL